MARHTARFKANEESRKVTKKTPGRVPSYLGRSDERRPGQAAFKGKKGGPAKLTPLATKKKGGRGGGRNPLAPQQSFFDPLLDSLSGLGQKFNDRWTSTFGANNFPTSLGGVRQPIGSLPSLTGVSAFQAGYGRGGGRNPLATSPGYLNRVAGRLLDQSELQGGQRSTDPGKFGLPGPPVLSNPYPDLGYVPPWLLEDDLYGGYGGYGRGGGGGGYGGSNFNWPRSSGLFQLNANR